MPAKQIVVMGDARNMARVADESVHLVVTSPPYWQLKDYGDENQIGFHQSYEEYLGSLNAVWSECVRALHPGCRIAINIGDQFTRAATYGRYKVLPIREEIVRFLEASGLDHMGAIIWQKVTTCNTSGGGVVMGSFPFPRNGIVKIDYEFILLFKKEGTPPRPTPADKEAARLTTEEWNEYFYGHWYFPGARQKDHIAVFPEELPRRLIRMFTFGGETVLDPFVGSGTTLKVAADLGRQGVGYEINGDYLPVIRTRLGELGQRDLFSSAAELEVHVDRGLPVPRPRRAVPHRPPKKAARSADPGGYGSVVRRGDRRGREDYRRVQEIRDVSTVVLDGGDVVKLLGIEANERSSTDGVDRLRELTRSSPVYFRDDAAVAGTAEGERRIYLYLKNRTFVNARLIREGLALPDLTSEYRHRKRFERYGREAGRS